MRTAHLHTNYGPFKKTHHPPVLKMRRLLQGILRDAPHTLCLISYTRSLGNFLGPHTLRWPEELAALSIVGLLLENHLRAGVIEMVPRALVEGALGSICKSSF